MDFTLTPTLITAIASSVFAVLSFALNFALVRRQAQVQLESLRLQSDSDVIAWGREAINALAEGQRLIAVRSHITDTAFAQDRIAAMQRLSSLADEGRLFFPNIISGDYGAAKESAFQGHRPPVLHAIIFGYYILENWDLASRDAPGAMNGLWRCRRLVVSEVQMAIDPRRRRKVIAAMSKETGEPVGDAYEAARQLADVVETLIPGVLKQKGDAMWMGVEARRRRAKTAPKTTKAQ